MIRTARPDEMKDVYLMGRDAWTGALSVGDYLKSCAASVKYRSGTWYVLEDQKKLLASLIVYRLSGIGDGAYGLGSIAVPSDDRNHGHATRLIRGVLEILDEEGAVEIYLHSDIAPALYERLGFRALPKALQASAKSICMLRSSVSAFEALTSAPDYF
ncbi:MAG: GNAT family N-acetyltransferase [Elusimicrobiota bacterium]